MQDDLKIWIASVAIAVAAIITLAAIFAISMVNTVGAAVAQAFLPLLG
ncbi:MAG: hypothetical protein ACXWJT_06755 [Xanthobacteraceae bacterium]